MFQHLIRLFTMHLLHYSNVVKIVLFVTYLCHGPEDDQAVHGTQASHAVKLHSSLVTCSTGVLPLFVAAYSTDFSHWTSESVQGNGGVAWEVTVLPYNWLFF